MKIYYIPMDLW